MHYKNTHRLTITVSGEMLREIDRRIPDRRPVCRERFILDLLQAHLVFPKQTSVPDISKSNP